MTELGDGRGILYPAQLPTFHRQAAPAHLADRIRWFWVPRWHLAPGQVSRQRLLPFPAANLVVEPSGVWLVGATTGAAHRDLHDTGWAVGALLRPAGLRALHPDPRELVDRQIPVTAPGLHAGVVSAMSAVDPTAGRDEALQLAASWADQHLGAPDEGGRLANRLEDLVASDPSIIRVDQLADRLHLSVRGVQRLTHRHIGLTPLAVIRRYRLQEAAHRLRQDPSLTIAHVAADLGYADHAHLTTDFRMVLGSTPTAYRRETGAARPHTHDP